MSFYKDKIIGEIGEDNVVKLLQTFDIHVIKNTNKEKYSDYDLICTAPAIYNSIFTIEVKNDIYAVKTGNIALEVSRAKGKQKSGLLITKADLWTHIIGQKVYVGNVKSVQKYVQKNKPKRIIESAGDGNAKILLFEAKRILSKAFIRIDLLAQKEGATAIQKLLKGV